MPHAFAQIAFTPKVKAEQQRDGSLRTAFVYGLGKDNDPASFVATALPTLNKGQLVTVRGGPIRIEAV